jgi:hypothetical protein
LKLVKLLAFLSAFDRVYSDPANDDLIDRKRDTIPTMFSINWLPTVPNPITDSLNMLYSTLLPYYIDIYNNININNINNNNMNEIELVKTFIIVIILFRINLYDLTPGKSIQDKVNTLLTLTDDYNFRKLLNRPKMQRQDSIPALDNIMHFYHASGPKNQKSDDPTDLPDFLKLLYGIDPVADTPFGF